MAGPDVRGAAGAGSGAGPGPGPGAGPGAGAGPGPGAAVRVALDRSARRRAGGQVLVAGSPLRLFRLGPAGIRALDAIERGEAPPATARPLVETLLDAGAAHPRPAGTQWARADVTLVVPSLGRVPEWPEEVVRGLGACVLVDDGSDPPLVPPPGWRLVRRERNGGPAAARSSGLAEVRTPLVAFVDADATPTSGWLEPLLAHFDDPRVALVAPRVTTPAPTPPATHPPAPAPLPPELVGPENLRRIAPQPLGPENLRRILPLLLGPENLRRIPGLISRGVMGAARGRYEASRSPLDLGPDEGRVAPGTRISYLPAAALVARVEALRAAGGFDPRLRTGEDVDLVWRLLAAGHRVRYEPTAHVGHEPRATWRGWLAQRAAYGASAAALDARHPDALPPAVLNRWSLAAWLLVAAGHPVAGAAVTAAATTVLARRLGTRTGTTSGTRADRTATVALAVTLAGRGTVAAGRQLGAASTRTWWPLLLAASVASRRVRRLAVVALLLPSLLEWWERSPDLDPVTFTALRALDDAAYGWGVWRGCLAERRAGPLLPRVT